MVMEAPPSPQSVGREFVRQYYTLLNKAPTHLHRFYNNQSSFVHGGLDPNRETTPMIGQKQIHQKIQQLNFRDCHAKITQVDSQGTLGNGVVVQVTGELSNAGQPMRRFTQTFVLAAQSPKKYYVHNDIFRYQDEIISDEECEGENRSENDDDLNQDLPVLNDVVPPPQINQQQQQQQQQQQPIAYYNPNAAAGAPLQANLQQVPPPPHHHSQPPPHVLNTPAAAVPAVNGAVHPDDINVLPGQVPQHVPAPQVQNLGATIPNLQAAAAGLVQAQVATSVSVQQPAVEEVQQQPPQQQLQQPPQLQQQTSPPQHVDSTNDVHGDSGYTEEQQEPEPEIAEQPQEQVSNEPKTYATLLKSGSNSSSYGVSQSNYASQPPKSLSPNRFDSRDFQSQGLSNNSQSSGPLGQRNSSMSRPPRVSAPRPRQDIRSAGPGRSSFNDDSNSYDERRRSQGNSFGDRDANQLFLGNLPHSATEDDLRDIFLEFGQIVELRIHSKPLNYKGQAGQRAPPNYGFITYENQQAVQNCLQAKPIYYPRKDPNGTLLNVEIKKPKDRPSYGGNNRIMNDNNGPRPRDNNGPRQGPGGGGGISRGGNMGGGPGGNRPNNYNRGPPQNRGPNSSNNGNNTFTARR